MTIYCYVNLFNKFDTSYNLHLIYKRYYFKAVLKYDRIQMHTKPFFNGRVHKEPSHFPEAKTAFSIVVDQLFVHEYLWQNCVFSP